MIELFMKLDFWLIVLLNFVMLMVFGMIVRRSERKRGVRIIKKRFDNFYKGK